MRRMITMDAHPRPTDRQMDEHRGKSATIRSKERIARRKAKNKYDNM